MPASASARRVGRPARFAGDLAGLHRHERALIGLDREHELEEPGPRIAFDVELDAALAAAPARSAISCTSAVVMCRASARGCTVMPGAPASMHVRTASITDGIVPPRELRTVATLFTLTESLITQDCARVHARSAISSAHCANRPLVFAFEHDAQQRLGARIADQQPAVAGELLLDLAHRVGDRRHLLADRSSASRAR